MQGSMGLRLIIVQGSWLGNNRSVKITHPFLPLLFPHSEDRRSECSLPSATTAATAANDAADDDDDKCSRVQTYKIFILY